MKFYPSDGTGSDELTKGFEKISNAERTKIESILLQGTTNQALVFSRK
jgi:hypothetical protein